jgi:hypothetical protein
MEAVKQGSASIGLKSKTHAVVVGLQRSTSKLSSHQQKIFEVELLGSLCEVFLIIRLMRVLEYQLQA